MQTCRAWPGRAGCGLQTRLRRCLAPRSNTVPAAVPPQEPHGTALSPSPGPARGFTKREVPAVLPARSDRDPTGAGVRRPGLAMACRGCGTVTSPTSNGLLQDCRKPRCRRVVGRGTPSPVRRPLLFPFALRQIARSGSTVWGRGGLVPPYATEGSRRQAGGALTSTIAERGRPPFLRLLRWSGCWLLSPCRCGNCVSFQTCFNSSSLASTVKLVLGLEFSGSSRIRHQGSAVPSSMPVTHYPSPHLPSSNPDFVLCSYESLVACSPLSSFSSPFCYAHLCFPLKFHI